ncbi:uncharacterized protein LOC127805622 [Diospyros lotus]|uniref:uncharacterized protein LOC127805622 n=1 Tax=Diospyros lotus TaxID=55363 RepID=UPI00224F2D31|nr:uncharacterized protein LOC127805622 [Diospyros lotus]
MDRKLYAILTMELQRDPHESMRTMALWIWLERFGYKNLIERISSMPHFLINELVKEAVICENYLNTNLSLQFSRPNDLLLTQSLTSNEISLRYFHENKLTIFKAIAKITSDVCVRAFKDIMKEAIKRNYGQYLAAIGTPMPSFVQPNLAQQMIYGAVNTYLPQTSLVHPEDRSLFATFSRGEPVGEMEIREFFNNFFGDCVESIYIQEVQVGEQPIFARIIFNSLSWIELILDGLEKAKFIINGKHVWMRKFVSRRHQTTRRHNT